MVPVANGYALLSDLEDMGRLFRTMERYQEVFLATLPHPDGYPWPKDALHWWSRIWEYPFTASHLASVDRESTILDFGSGITFFPYFVAATFGSKVVCVDQDLRFERPILRTAEALQLPVSFAGNRETEIPLPSNSIDCIYCVSVLEHMPDPAGILAEFHRVLKPASRLILTMDIAGRSVDVNGITPDKYWALSAALDDRFIPATYRRTHPADCLTTLNSPYPPCRTVHSLRRLETHTRRGANLALTGSLGPPAWWQQVLLCEGYAGTKRLRPKL
jgi:SAM-dependent methyltransferase